MISTQIVTEQFTGNGSTSTKYVLPFKVLEADHVAVTVTNTDDGAVTELVNGTDFTVTDLDESSTSFTTATAWASSYIISGTAEMPLTQDTNLENHGAFDAEVVERRFDYLTLLIQIVSNFLRLTQDVHEESGNLYVDSTWAGRTVKLTGSATFILPSTHDKSTRFTVLSTGFTVVCSADYVFKGTLATGGNLSTFSAISGTTHLTAIEFIGGKWTIYDLDTYT